MAPSNASDRERLVSPVGLAIMLLVVLTVLWFLLPEQARFQTRQAMEKPDALSLAYLRAVLRGDPERDDLRLNLVRQLLALGQLDEAARLLDRKPPKAPQLASQARLLQAELRLREVMAGTPGHGRDHLRETLLPMLAELPASKAVRTELARLAELALQAGEPGLAAGIARLIARDETATAPRWWRRAGRWALAAGEPLAASADFTRAAETGDDRQAAIAAIDAALAAARPDRALRLARRFLARWPDASDLLARGVDVALQVNRQQDAARWNRRYLRHHPNDLAALRRQRDIELALGQLETAARLARRVAGHPNATREDRLRLARILEWNGDPEGALAAWQRLADGRPAVEGEVRRLARMLLDPDAEIASLRREQRHTGHLSRRKLLRLASLYEQRGEPERSLTVLSRLLERHPDDARAWRARLRLLVQTGREERALALLAERQRREGASDALHRQRMRLFWLLLREKEAWREAQRIRTPLAFRDPADGALHAELAFRHGDLALAERLYARLYTMYANHRLTTAHPDDDIRERIRIIHERLIRLADRRGDVQRATAVGLHGWRQLGDPNLLWLSLQVAARHDDVAALERLLKLAMNLPDTQGQLVTTLLEIADWKQRHGQFRDAEALYRRVLTRNPRRPEARLGLLWLYIDTRQHAPLRRRLLAWQQEALDDSRYWPAFAAGWSALGEPARALPWIERRVRLDPRDPLWLLTWADTLDALGRRDSAFRVRRHALDLGSGGLRRHLLTRRKLDETDRALLQALQREFGLARLEPLITGLAGDRLDAVFLAGWYLSGERDVRARAWLLQRQASRLAQPAWQAISLALLDNDPSRIAALLEGPGLSPLDRVRGLARLGRRNEALALALSQVRDAGGSDARQAATAWSAELYRDLPTSLTAAHLSRRIGALDIFTQALSLRFSRRNLSLHGRLETGRLELDPARYDLTGRNTERILAGGLEWQGRRHRLWFEYGQNRRDDRTTPLRRLGWRLRLAREGELRLEAGRGLRSDASEAIRADALKNEERVTWYQPLTGRTSLQIALGRHDFRSRGDHPLARGRFLDASLGEQLAMGTNDLQIRLQGTWMANDLAAILPADMAARLPAGATVADVIPADYAALGLGGSLARGALADRAPRVGGLRYRLDGWVGPVWPENRLGYALEASLGTRLLGSDELSLGVAYSDVLNVVAGQANARLQVQYRYFFGR